MCVKEMMMGEKAKNYPQSIECRVATSPYIGCLIQELAGLERRRGRRKKTQIVVSKKKQNYLAKSLVERDDVGNEYGRYRNKYISGV